MSVIAVWYTPRILDTTVSYEQRLPHIICTMAGKKLDWVKLNAT
jgi:hypothetical protein